MACSCQYDARAAGGEVSRTAIDLEKLKEAGWIVEKNCQTVQYPVSFAEQETFSLHERRRGLPENRKDFRTVRSLQLWGEQISRR